MRWLVAVLVGALLAVLAGQARAAASRVALVRQGDPPPEIAEASTRVTAELQAAGFEVVTFAARGSDAQAQVVHVLVDDRDVPHGVGLAASSGG